MNKELEVLNEVAKVKKSFRIKSKVVETKGCKSKHRSWSKAVKVKKKTTAKTDCGFINYIWQK